MNKFKNQNDFQLDRNSGREKILRAMYSPQGYRDVNKKTFKSRLRWPGVVVVVVLIGALLHQFALI